MSDLQPNEEGTVCCVCRKPIVPLVNAIHGAYWGKEARHYECTEASKYKEAVEQFDRTHKRAMSALDALRHRLREPRDD